MNNDFKTKEIRNGMDGSIAPLREVAQLYIPSKEVYPLGIRAFDRAMDGGLRDGELVVVSGGTGEGKCHGKGTKILMYNGEIKNVEDIVVGDEIMGDDSTPRTVLSLARGREQMYEIQPYRSEPYTVNESHILSLKKTGTEEIIDIPLREYLKKSKKFKWMYKGYKVGVEFKEKELPIEPYFLGLWLGDGDTNDVRITNMDKEVENYLAQYAKRINCKLNIRNQFNNKSRLYSITKGRSREDRVSSLQAQLRKLGVIGDKHIPNIYKFNSRENRLRLLAGLIDSDGYTNHNCYEVILKLEKLAQDIVYLCRSLGMFSYYTLKWNKKYKKNYYRVKIFGELSDVPVLLERKKLHKRRQIKNSLHYRFKVKKLKVDDYYGFQLDGNHRYLLGDFSVTHNTTFCINLSINLSKKTVPSLFFSYEMDNYYLYQSFLKIEQNLDLIYSPIELVSSELRFIEEQIKEGVDKKAIKVVFIDHLHFLIPLKSATNTSLLIGAIVRELKKMAVRNKVIIFLIAHTRKLNTGDELNLSSIRDSGLVVAESDYVFLVERTGKKAPDNKITRNIITKTSGIANMTNKSRITLAKNRRTGRLIYKDFRVEDGKFIEITNDYE